MMKKCKRKRYIKIIILMSLVCFLMPIKANAKNIVSTTHQKYDYDEYVEDLELLEEKYSEHCRVEVLGQTADKRNLYEVTIGNPEAEKHLIVIANLHAREYMTTQLCMRQIEYYLQNYNKKMDGKKVADVLDKVAIHYVPSCNPDGTAISQYGFKAIRNKSLYKKLKKMQGNSKTWKANARGVDLNMNWGYKFKKRGKAAYAGYTGKKAASELETKALLSMIKDVSKQGKIVGIVSYHAMGSVIFGNCGKNAKSSVKKNTKKMYQVAKKTTGYYLYGNANSKCQSREYFLYVAKIPCITLEIGNNTCPVPQKQFASIWKKNKKLVYREAKLFY